MSENKSEKAQNSKRTLTDDQIITERTFGRRSFLTAVGSIVVGGAAALALGDALEAAAQQPSDPDSKDAKNPSDPDAKKKVSTKKKNADPDAKKPSDPDAKKSNKKSSDPDAKKASDPDQKK